MYSLQLRSASSTVHLHDKKTELSLSASLNHGPQEVKKNYADKLTVWGGCGRAFRLSPSTDGKLKPRGSGKLGSPRQPPARNPDLLTLGSLSCEPRQLRLPCRHWLLSWSLFCVKNGVRAAWGITGAALPPGTRPPGQTQKSCRSRLSRPERSQWLATGKYRLCDCPQRKASFRLISFIVVMSFKNIQTQKMPSEWTLKHGTWPKSPSHTPSCWVPGPTRAQS